MQRSVFYSVVGLALLVTATGAALSVTRYLSARLYVPPRGGISRSATVSERVEAVAPPDKWTNVFSPSAGMGVPVKAGPATEAKDTPKIVYALIGTIASSNPDASRAILWAEGMKEPRLFHLKQVVEPGVTLVRIDRDAAWLLRGKVREKLELLPVGSKVRIAAPPAAPGGAAGPAIAGGTPPAASGGTDLRVNKIGENTYSMDEASLTQLTGNFNQFMTQVRLIPYFEGNKNSGYRLAAIRPGTAFEKMGFVGGDVIQAVNNIELTSPERMFTIFQNLKDEKRVSVNVLRQGQKTTLTYEIR
ncbi:MAG TPA: type II secretion system protein GspC [Candidatus Deferrimicrobiaceae bacterium]|jgi:general secretion pathway protein C